MPGTRCTGLRDGDDQSGYVRLNNGEASIACTQEISSPGDYVKDVNLNLIYDYRDSTSKILVVKNTE